MIEVQRIRKDSETLSSPNVSTISRVRRESERLRNELLSSDGTNTRNSVNQKTKIYRLPQYTTSVSVPGTLPAESKSLLLAAGNSFH